MSRKKVVVVHNRACEIGGMINAFSNGRLPDDLEPIIVEAPECEILVNNSTVVFTVSQASFDRDDLSSPMAEMQYICPRTDIFMYAFVYHNELSYDDLRDFLITKKAKFTEKNSKNKFINILVGVRDSSSKKDPPICISYSQGEQLAHEIGAVGFFDVDIRNQDEIVSLFHDSVNLSLNGKITWKYEKYKEANNLKFGINGSTAYLVNSPDYRIENNLTIPKALKAFFWNINVIGIDILALSECNSITSINFEEGSQLTTLSRSCFPSSLKELSLPSTIKCLKNGWSNGITDYLTIKVGSDDLSLHRDILYSSDFSQIRYIPENCSDIIISSKIQSFGDALFEHIANKENENIQYDINSVKIETDEDDSKCFQFNEVKVFHFKKLILPSNKITFVNKESLESYQNLEEIVFENDDSKNSEYSCFSGCLYSKDFKKLIYAPKNKESLIIHNRTEEIESNAAQNSNIVDVSVADKANPKIITTMKIGDNAFKGCQALKTVSLINFAEIDNGKGAFENCSADFKVIINADTKIQTNEISEDHIQRETPK